MRRFRIEQNLKPMEVMNVLKRTLILAGCVAALDWEPPLCWRAAVAAAAVVVVVVAAAAAAALAGGA